MRTAFTDEEDDLEPPRDEADREVLLSPTTLLVIFFGLVLICGLCFGLGYTLGRRAPSETADATPPQESPRLVSASQPKPSAGAPTAANPAPVSDTPAPDAAGADDSSSATPDAQSTPADTANQPPAPSAAKPVSPAAAPQVKPALPPAATLPAAATPAGIMVQIAAISNPADANVLVNALRKRGYSVSVRNQPGDALLHVQVGPFTSRADAIAMRQKLLADGYNAILK